MAKVFIIGILPTCEIYSISGYNYILDVIDNFFKWYQGYALKTKTGDEILAYIIIIFIITIL